MSRISQQALIVLSLVTIIGLFVGSAAAETIYLYDFDRLSTGNLDDHDGWYKVTGTGNPNQVGDNSAIWSGNYYYNNSSDSQSSRANDSFWGYTMVQDEDFDVSSEVLVIGGGSGFMYGGLQQREGASPDKHNWLFCGMENGDDLLWRIKLGSSDTEVRISMDTGIETDAEKVFLVGVKATASGSGQYSLQPYYQNITDGGAKTDFGTAYTYTINDVANRWDSLTVRGSTADGELDNIRIAVGEVPEPSALALLAAGLIGLLAYAWRKRK